VASRLSPPLICLVTDRHRLARHLNRSSDDPFLLHALLAQIEGAARGGVRLIQVREPDLDARPLTAFVRDARARVAREGTHVMVNDRLDVAIASDAGGVHLKASSIAAVDARRLGPEGWLIGQSVHAISEITDDRIHAADFFVFGSVFATRSKPTGWPATGLTALAAAVLAADGRPVLGIGGIGPASAPAIAQSGAAGFAAIDAFLPKDCARIAESVQIASAELVRAFDSGLPLS
jgi:thiamine-phosphate diphosphorylase